jgi:hypothetical protein
MAGKDAMYLTRRRGGAERTEKEPILTSVLALQLTALRDSVRWKNGNHRVPHNLGN